MEKQENRAKRSPTGKKSVATTDAFKASSMTSEVDDLFANILSLKLKKPKRWKWELTTSRSCSSIAMPRIMLYNHRGDLLADANEQQEQIFRQPSEAQGRAKNSQKLERAATNREVNDQFETTTNKPLNRGFADFQAEGSLPSEPSTWPKVSARPDFLATRDNLFVLNAGHRASSCKERLLNTLGHPDPRQLSVTDTQLSSTTSSSTRAREKRRHRRSQSSLGNSSGSILERRSLNRRQFTSPEYYDVEVTQEPLYNKADTAVEQADSVNWYGRRRKMCKLCNKIHYWLDEETSTSESSLMSSSSLIKLDGSIKSSPQQPSSRKPKQSINLRDGRTDSLTQKRLYPKRRSRSSATVKWPQPSPSSSSGTEASISGIDDKRHKSRDTNNLLRRSSEFRRSKEGLVAINTKNEILVDSFERETAR